MKRTTITLPDNLDEALERYRQEHESNQPVSSLIQAAIREYLKRRGYLNEPAEGGFHITPATKGSGSADVSVAHDRYFAETIVRE